MRRYHAPAMHYLSFDLLDGTDGIHTLEAVASTRAEAHAAVMAEVQQVLDWAWRQQPHGHGPVEEGQVWDHDLSVVHEPGGWVAVSLTITATEHFAQQLLGAFSAA